MSSESNSPSDEVIATCGIAGLDEILGGGFTPRRLYSG